MGFRNTWTCKWKKMLKNKVIKVRECIGGILGCRTWGKCLGRSTINSRKWPKRTLISETTWGILQLRSKLTYWQKGNKKKKHRISKLLRKNIVIALKKEFKEDYNRINPFWMMIWQLEGTNSVRCWLRQGLIMMLSLMRRIWIWELAICMESYCILSDRR